LLSGPSTSSSRTHPSSGDAWCVPSVWSSFHLPRSGILPRKIGQPPSLSLFRHPVLCTELSPLLLEHSRIANACCLHSQFRRYTVISCTQVQINSVYHSLVLPEKN
jgi:hypothetical protein